MPTYKIIIIIYTIIPSRTRSNTKLILTMKESKKRGTNKNIETKY